MAEHYAARLKREIEDLKLEKAQARQYAARLKREIEDLKLEKAQARQSLLDLVVYLRDEKFFVDTTVQTQDVVSRLQDALGILQAY